MNPLPLQWMTLAGSVVLLPMIALALRLRLITWQLGGLLLFIASMYATFYMWLFWVAVPGNYANLSAAMRAAEVWGAVGVLSIVLAQKLGTGIKRWIQSLRSRSQF